MRGVDDDLPPDDSRRRTEAPVLQTASYERSEHPLAQLDEGGPGDDLPP